MKIKAHKIYDNDGGASVVLAESMLVAVETWRKHNDLCGSTLEPVSVELLTLEDDVILISFEADQAIKEAPEMDLDETEDFWETRDIVKDCI